MKQKTLLTLLAIAGSMILASIAMAGVGTFAYDEMNRLTRVDYDDGTSIVYTYDAIGNRLHTYTNPKADFSMSSTISNGLVTVNFTDNSTGNPTAWQWNFGDGATSTSQNPSHTYNANGTYTISLTASNLISSSSQQVTTSVAATFGLPRASFTATPLKGLFPLAVQFTDASTGAPTSWLWNLGDGTTSSAQNLVHTYNTAGTYTVSLTVSNVTGSNQQSKTSYIVSNAPPIRIARATPLYFTSLQAAYNAASDGDTIQCQGVNMAEYLTVNRSISVTFDGGYYADYSSNSGTTNLKGMITTTSGVVTIKNFYVHN